MLSKPRRGVLAHGCGAGWRDAFLLCAGSTLVRETKPSFPARIRAIRDELAATGAIEEAGPLLRLTRDHIFASPSAAAAFVLGVSANGKHNWQPEDAARR